MPRHQRRHLLTTEYWTEYCNYILQCTRELPYSHLTLDWSLPRDIKGIKSLATIFNTAFQVPLGIALFRYFMVCHAVFCLNQAYSSYQLSFKHSTYLTEINLTHKLSIFLNKKYFWWNCPNAGRWKTNIENVDMHRLSTQVRHKILLNSVLTKYIKWVGD